MMRLVKNLDFLCSLIGTSIKSSVSTRGAFMIESALMIANNMIFFSVWWIFFRQFNDVAGWKIQDMTILMVIGIGAYGLKQICFGGAHTLSRIVINGDLDPFMTQPKNLLIHLASSRSLSKGWGHIMSAFILAGLGDLIHIPEFPLLVIGIICGGLVFASMEVITHSLIFWFGPMESLAHRYCDSLFLFALYPTNIYSGVLQLVLFTVIPAGVIGYLPVELVRSFTWLKFFGLMMSTSIFIYLAFTVFQSGLKRYESGNQFGTKL